MKEQTVPVKSAQTDVPATREESRTLTPPVDIFEVDDGLVVVVDLPGTSKDQIDVRVEKGILTIKGSGITRKHGDPIHTEYELMDYFRQFELGEQVDQDKIHAEMKQGVLTVHLPKPPEAKPRKITVNIES